MISSSDNENLQNITHSQASPREPSVDVTGNFINGSDNPAVRTPAVVDGRDAATAEGYGFQSARQSWGLPVEHDVQNSVEQRRLVHSPRVSMPVEPAEIFSPPSPGMPLPEPDKSPHASPPRPTLRRVGRLVDFDGEPVSGFSKGRASLM